MQECIKAGALAYVLKPFDFDQVLQIISKALDKRF